MDITFTFRDAIYIVVIVVGLVGSYWRTQNKIDKISLEIQQIRNNSMNRSDCYEKHACAAKEVTDVKNQVSFIKGMLSERNR